MSKVVKQFFFDDPPVFLEKKLNFLAIAAVLLTTLFGWFNSNSWSIILLGVCPLLNARARTHIKTAMSNPLFLAYFLFFLIDTAGYLHTHNLVTQSKAFSKEATMVAVAFVFCAGKFADQRSYRQLITVYSLLLLASSVYCLAIALVHYIPTKDSSVFFYHTLTSAISQNAVFYSVYVLFGIIFLLSSYGEPAISGLSPKSRKGLRYGLLFFFLGMMVLLSSRLLLVITILILIGVFARRYSYRRNQRALVISGCSVLLIIILLDITDNPIRARFREITDVNTALMRQDQFKSYMHFSSLELRVVQWRFALEILNARHAWLFGVSPGDSQDLLDQKYTSSNMYIGNPADGPDRHIRGFLGFNFHNQFLEVLVRTGLVGLASFLTIFLVLFSRAREYGIREAWWVVLTIAILFIPEAPLTMQHGVFLFCFFPLLALSRPLAKAISPAKPQTRPK